jgi:hypothetical protein
MELLFSLEWCRVKDGYRTLVDSESINVVEKYADFDEK